MKLQTKTFNRKKYLESQCVKDVPFYQQVVSTSLFECFFIDLILSHTEHRTDMFLEKLQAIKTSPSRQRANSTKKKASFAFKKEAVFKTLDLSEFTMSQNLPLLCIERISDDIEVVFDFNETNFFRND